jgi:hypothetical protein
MYSMQCLAEISITTYYIQRSNNGAHDRIDKVTANYLNTKAEADHKTPAQIISEMVRERITASRGEPSPFGLG